MTSVLAEIHDAIVKGLGAVANHDEPTRELGQVEHKLIEARLWLQTVPGAVDAINAIGRDIEDVGEVVSGTFPTASAPPTVPQRSMASDPQGPPVEAVQEPVPASVEAVPTPAPSTVTPTGTAQDGGPAAVPEPPAPAPDIATADHAEQPKPETLTEGPAS